MNRKQALAAISFAALLAIAPSAPARVAPKQSGRLDKADSALQQLVANRGLARLGRGRGLRVSGAGRVLTDVYVKGDVTAAARRLQAEGMAVKATSRRAPFLIVEGWLPIAAIPRVAALGSTKALSAVTAFGTNAGSVQSQGDAAHRGPAARGSGHNGAGVKVGLISDSINQVGIGVAGSQSSGDLPPSVQVLSDDTGGSDEGRAMGEIVYDEAPGITQMAFASGTASGPAGKASAINSLVANGARVIADDIFYLSEPFFQDGPIAQATDAARAKDVAYLASAGNRARQSYESGFRASSGCPAALPPGGPCHDFGGGDEIQRVVTNVPTNGFVEVALQWDEAWGHAQTDLDAYLVDDAGVPLTGLVVQGTSNNISTGLPVEIAQWQNTGPTTSVSLAIRRFAGSRAPFMKHIVFTDLGNVAIEHGTNSDAVDPDATAARGALSVAAVRYSQPGLDSPEPFSSRGPLRRLFDKFGNRLATAEVRQKPDIAAADGVDTTIADFSPFYGTSAAAPSAAGVAALIRSAKSSITAADVYAILRNRANTIDCALAGNPDSDCGYGFVLADAAMRMANDPSPPSITVHRTKANGRHGWYVRKKKVNVSWSVADDGSPVTATNGCTASTVTKDTRGRKFTCFAHSAGGTTSKTVTIRRDSKKPKLSKIRAGKSFAVNKRGKASSARRKGTRVRFRLSEKATVTLKVQKRVHGRYRTVRTFKAKGKKGRNSVRFSGRIKRRHRRAKKLAAGRYRFRVQAADTAGNRSRARTRKFRIAR